MTDNIKPVAGRVVVLPDPAPEKTDSGLFIPDSVKTPPSSGTVTHVSDTEPLFKVGDRVLFVKNAGVELGDKFLMREEDIYAVLGA